MNNYSISEIKEFIREEDVKFIKLAFVDIFGQQKNISILASELENAIEYGVRFDASAVGGFFHEVKSDLFLFPDISTMEVLPWRPSRGRVVRMFCEIRRCGNVVYELDSRAILKKAAAAMNRQGISCSFDAEFEYYLFKTDGDGNPTDETLDKASYFDVAPADKGENVRRDICLTLEAMDIHPETSHHEQGPGQNEITFRQSDPLSAADNAVSFKNVVSTVAAANGLYADFSPKPIDGESGSGMHINISLCSDDGREYLPQFMAGLLEHIYDITFFLNPTEQSYKRLGERKAPAYISWSRENRSQLIRVPVGDGRCNTLELRSPDACANPYIAYALIIYAGLDGITRKLMPPEPTDINLYTADDIVIKTFKRLPKNLLQAKAAALSSDFVAEVLPDKLLDAVRDD